VKNEKKKHVVSHECLRNTGKQKQKHNEDPTLTSFKTPQIITTANGTATIACLCIHGRKIFIYAGTSQTTRASVSFTPFSGFGGTQHLVSTQTILIVLHPVIIVKIDEKEKHIRVGKK